MAVVTSFHNGNVNAFDRSDLAVTPARLPLSNAGRLRPSTLTSKRDHSSIYLTLCPPSALSLGAILSSRGVQGLREASSPSPTTSRSSC